MFSVPLARHAALLVCALLVGCRSAPEEQGDLPAGGAFEEVRRVEVRFEGNTTFDDDRLRRVVEVDLEGIEERTSVRAGIDDAAYSLELFHRAQGFPACRVDYTVEASAVGERLAVLQIDEGVRVEITEVEFTGNALAPSEQLEGYLRPPPAGVFSSSRVWYVEDSVAEGLGAVALHYKTRGFLDVEVELEDPTPEGEDGAWPERLQLRVQVSEGPRYVLERIVLEGGVPEVEARFDRGPWIGGAFTRRATRALRGELAELYGRSGYPDVRITKVSEERAPSGASVLGLRVRPGPRVRIGDLRIEGLERTSEARVRAAVELRQGDFYDVSLERETFRNLYGLGVFSSVRLDLVGEGEQRELVVGLQEAPSRELYVEPGYGSYERLRIGLGWRERNLFGGARSLDIEGRVSELAQRGVAGITDPRLFDTNTRANLSLFADRREEPSFTRTDLGSTLTLSRKLSRELRLSAAYQYRLSSVESDDLTDPDVQDALDDVNVSSITVTPNWDTRDSPFLPKSGGLGRLSFEVADEALGSQLDFLRSRWTASWFRPMWRRATLGLSWRGGAITPIGATDTIPVQERFFNGGENTVRSFREDQLGAKDSNGDPVGGEAYNVFTVELRQRLQGRLEGALFYDGGNLVPDAADFFEMEGFRHAIGMGIRYVLPVGPMRLDASWNPDASSDESEFVVHFSVGFSF